MGTSRHARIPRNEIWRRGPSKKPPLSSQVTESRIPQSKLMMSQKEPGRKVPSPGEHSPTGSTPEQKRGPTPFDRWLKYAASTDRPTQPCIDGFGKKQNPPKPLSEDFSADDSAMATAELAPSAAVTTASRMSGQGHHSAVCGTPAERSPWKRSRCLLAAALVSLTIVAMWLFFVARNQNMFRSFRRDQQLGQDTFYPGAVTASHVNRSVSPCEDFAAHSCSLRTSRACRRGSALMYEAMVAWFRSFEEVISNASTSFPRVSGRLLAVYNSCVARNISENETRQDVSLFKHFARRLKVPWPDAPLPDVDPLGVLVDLTLNWQVHLWFRADILRHVAPVNSNALLSLQPSGLDTGFAYVHEDVYGAGSYKAYWNGFYKILGPPGAPPRPEAEIRSFAYTDRAIRQRIIAAANNTVERPRRFALRDIQKYTANISVSRWRQQLNENARPRKELTPSDVVFVSDVALLEAINDLFLDFSSKELLEHIAWTFVRALAPLADRSLLAVAKGDERETEVERGIFCASAVEAMYGWLIVSLHVPPAFPAAHRHAADTLFASVRNAAAEKLARLTWLDDLFKQWAVEKIRDMKTLIWPPDGLLTDEGLMQAYAAWFENETSVSTSFFKAWLRAASARKRQLTDGGSGSRGEACLASAKAPPRNYALPYFAYDDLLNSVSVSVAAILSPYFRGPDIDAMRHAGVGLAYALEMVRAFDPSGAVKFNAKSDLVNASVLSAWRDQIAKKGPANYTLCAAQTSTAGNPKTGALTAQFFPEVPAMELAHKAFEASLGLKDGARRAANDLNEERVFFITACLVMCPCPGSFNRYRFDCNKAVANFGPFRLAFNCPNRVEPNKCGFFD